MSSAQTPRYPPLKHPLDGIRVLELANYMAGPYCGMLLGDMGAEVIKVENPQGGDYTRLSAPQVQGESAGFMTLNRNKQSVTLNLKSERGREIFKALARTADVLVENFRPGTMADLGLAYPALAAINPRLIYSAATGFGQSGPYRQRAALDLIVQGMSGLMSITGEPSAGLFGAYAILAALFARERTGRGQFIDVSLLESALALEVWETSGYFANGQVPEPLGSAHRVNAPYQAFRTADGYVTIGATSPANWKAFCAALNLQPLESDARFATVPARRANYLALAQTIEAVTTAQPSEHWYRLLEQAGVPCGVLNRLDQILSDEQIEARQFVVELPHSKVGTVRATGSPVRLSETPVRLERAGPLLGEHTREVLGGLGLSESELDELEMAGVTSARRA
ncbi:MAG: CoA transferase [Chloroflexi bacterium]|nr:CoA transferase [Chloroflexota bacterium]